MPASNDKFPQSVGFMILESTSFSYWIPHIYIWQIYIYSTNIFKTLLSSNRIIWPYHACHLLFSNYFTNNHNLWNLSVMWVLLLLFQQHVPDAGPVYYCQDVWLEELGVELETRARLQGGWLVVLLLFCAVHVKKTCSYGSSQGSVSKSDSLAEQQCYEARHSSGRPRTKTLPWSTSVRSSGSLPWFTAPCLCFSSSLPRSQQKTRMTTHFFWDGQMELIIILEHWHLE